VGGLANWLFSRLVDLAMRNRALERYRRASVGAARGIVLEIGVGSGLNLSLYSANIDHVYALDPSAELLAMARAAQRKRPSRSHLCERPRSSFRSPMRSSIPSSSPGRSARSNIPSPP
jgi:SAM-dependent methyltransferase